MISRAFLLAAFMGCTAQPSESGAPPADTAAPPGTGEFATVELATVGLDVRTQTPVVLLREEETGESVAILVGLSEAEAIARTLYEIEMPRPMTHDLLASVIGSLGGELEEVRVTEIRDGTFYGELTLRVDGEDRIVDSRPSDAMALAIRTGARIRVSRQVLLESNDVDFVAPDGERHVVRTMGVSVTGATPELRERHDLPDQSGVVVIAVSQTAAAAGIEQGDFLLEAGGVALEEPMDFFEAIRGATGRVEIRLWRNGEERVVELAPPVRPGDERPRTTVTL